MYDKNLKSTALSNFAFSIRDQNARTFVMSYAVNDEGFVKTADQCPTDYQCFENAAKDKRLVVPPQGEKFKLCDALPKNECSGGFESTGITMFMKNEDGSSWQTNWVLDGKITETKGSEVKYVESALVSRLVYSARYSDGKTKSGSLVSGCGEYFFLADSC